MVGGTHCFPLNCCNLHQSSQSGWLLVGFLSCSHTTGCRSGPLGVNPGPLLDPSAGSVPLPGFVASPGVLLLIEPGKLSVPGGLTSLGILILPPADPGKPWLSWPGIASSSNPGIASLSDPGVVSCSCSASSAAISAQREHKSSSSGSPINSAGQGAKVTSSVLHSAPCNSCSWQKSWQSWVEVVGLSA